MKSSLLLWVVNATLVAYMGPVFKFNGCGFNNMIFEKQPCVTMYIDGALIPLGSTTYVSSVITYLLYYYCHRCVIPVYACCAVTLVLMCVYAYYLAVQHDVECHAIGYYFIYIAMALLVTFVVALWFNFERLLGK